MVKIGFKHSEKTKQIIKMKAIKRHFIPKSAFKNNRIPWNKGTKGLMKTPWNKGLGDKMKLNRLNRKGNLLSHQVWCKVNEIHRVPKGCVIHHLDLNPNNNNPENLQLLEDKYHKSMHNKIYLFRRNSE